MCSRFAYLSQGQLYVSNEQASPILYESNFAQGIRDRAFELHRRNAWKNRGGDDGKLISSAALWGASQSDPFQMRIELNSVSPGGEGDGFVYSLISPEISGVLALKGHGFGTPLTTHHGLQGHAGCLAAANRPPCRQSAPGCGCDHRNHGR
jgi:hypothetical protein